MNKLGAFGTLATFRFACLDDVCVLVLESSLIQLSIVDVETMRHLSDGSTIACIDVTLSDMLWLLLVQLGSYWMK